MDINESTVFKVLNEDGTTPQGYGEWYLPTGRRPGRWMPKIEGELVACNNGYHLMRPQDLIRWLGPTIWTVEYRGECVEAEDKIVVRQARLLKRVDTWNDRTTRLFACDCAERALETVGDADPRSIEAVRVARLYAVGKATDQELAAARAAARDAAWDAAGAGAAAGDAAWAAAWDAAGAGAAAGDAARAAARDAAWDAARAAAWDAAWDAAGAAAWDAARDAAWDAARAWQTERLLKYLTGELA